MSVLTVTNVPDEIVAELQRRATAHGVSVEDEARKILSATVSRLPEFSPEENRGFKEHLMTFPEISEEDEWVFNRHDPRNARAERPPVDLSD